MAVLRQCEDWYKERRAEVSREDSDPHPIVTHVIRGRAREGEGKTGGWGLEGLGCSLGTSAKDSPKGWKDSARIV
jgi:hypothetical protein